MVNKGRIHKELGKFFMISSNLIKSEDDMVIEIGQLIFYERRIEDKSTESKITEVDFDFVEKSLNEQRRLF